MSTYTSTTGRSLAKVAPAWWLYWLLCSSAISLLPLLRMPFDDSGHFFDPPIMRNLRKDRKWSDFTNETPNRVMRKLLPVMRGKVTALSGRLKDMLND